LLASRGRTAFRAVLQGQELTELGCNKIGQNYQLRLETPILPKMLIKPEMPIKTE